MKDLKPNRTELAIGTVLLGASLLGFSWSLWSMFCWFAGILGASVISWFAAITAVEFQVRRYEEEIRTLQWLLEKERAVRSRDMASDLNRQHAHVRIKNN